MIITFIEYFLWLFYLAYVQRTLSKTVFSDSPIRKALWDISVLILFVRLLDVALELNINYMSTEIKCFLNIFIQLVHPFLQGMILGNILLIFPIAIRMKDKFVILFTIFLIICILFTAVSRVFVIPNIV